MKILVIILASFLLYSGCGPKKLKKKEEMKVEFEAKLKPDYTTDDIINFKQEVKESYEELMKFKDDSDFHKFGFAKEGKYNSWFLKIQEQTNSPFAKELVVDRIIVGEVQLMGMEYIRSKGKETDRTKIFKEEFERAFYPNSSKYEQQLASTELQNGKLYAKWRITNSFVNISYIYAIYDNGGSYFGVNESIPGRIDNLKKIGEIFKIKDNEFGEYFKINSNKDMELFDKDGELKSSGYSAKLIK